MVALERLPLLPVPQDAELLVSLFSVAKAEWVSISKSCRQGAFKVSVGMGRRARRSENLDSDQAFLVVDKHWIMTNWALGDRLGSRGSTGRVRHDLTGLGWEPKERIQARRYGTAN